VWHEIPESTVLIVQPGADEQRPFRPHYEGAIANGSPVGSSSPSL
jgi:xanthine dehydrogenase iron-sulfur cluster and FAD-binding subunit A